LFDVSTVARFLKNEVKEMNELIRDCRYAVRFMISNPAFALTVVITLALAIGANTAIFSVVDAVLLRPLPYKGGDQIMTIFERSRDISDLPVSYPDFLDLREQSQNFEKLASFQPVDFNITIDNSPKRSSGCRISSTFFSVLGVNAAQGRTFQNQDDQTGAERTVLLSYSFWHTEFHEDRAILGKALTVDGDIYKVIGVLPENFKFSLISPEPQIFVPSALWASTMTNRAEHSHGLGVIGRLRPGVSVAQAHSELDIISQRLEKEYSLTNTGVRFQVQSLRDEMTKDTKLAILMVFGSVIFVLLIACSNIANLLLAKTAVRENEIAVRVAIGARPIQLIRQFLTESVLLSGIGAVLGLGVGAAGIKGLIAILPFSIQTLDLRLDGRVLIFTVVAAIVTGLIFGLAPAIQILRPDVSGALKQGSRTAVGASKGKRLRNILVITQVALAHVLLIGAVLMVESSRHALKVNLGFDPQNVFSFQVALPDSKYPQPGQKVEFYQNLLSRVSTLAEVQSAALVSPIPLSGSYTLRYFSPEGATSVDPHHPPVSGFHIISAAYLQTMSVQLLSGRTFDAADNEGAPRVALISRYMADHYWPHEDALGKRFKLGLPQSNGALVTVVGIVANTKQIGLDSDIKPDFYLHYLQFPGSDAGIVVKTPAQHGALLHTLQRQVSAIDKDEPIYNAQGMDELVAGSVVQWHVISILLGLFAALAVVLAAVGIHGLLTYSVDNRIKEIGVRMALGAQRSDALKLILGQAAQLTGIGVGIGLIASWLLTKVLSGLLFGVGATDIVIFFGVAIVLSIVGIFASYLPARRAAGIDPIQALRTT
jgi:putative ABC transport system permease protein